ncbi:unnamed protein product [Protopolystoma xenopodis]|uniref:Uncharacterized protein n=1 Tax=Protopolystoma xenopodis TaxID=117903 RepID=A0A448X8N3_9PLAT|nr:unnamed protein product [Protopolystoma xenopodis]
MRCRRARRRLRASRTNMVTNTLTRQRTVGPTSPVGTRKNGDVVSPRLGVESPQPLTRPPSSTSQAHLPCHVRLMGRQTGRRTDGEEAKSHSPQAPSPFHIPIHTHRHTYIHIYIHTYGGRGMEGTSSQTEKGQWEACFPKPASANGKRLSLSPKKTNVQSCLSATTQGGQVGTGLSGGRDGLGHNS